MTTAIHELVARARRGELDRVVARMASGWAIMAENQFLAGYCLLLADPVVPTLNALSGPARRLYLGDMARLGDAVTSVCTARRVNYEILGNLEPALHAHVIPRYEHEPADLRVRAIWAYPDAAFKAPETAFSIAVHGPLRDSIRAALLVECRAEAVPLWQAAASFAARAHAGHMRKDGRTPYYAHPVRVALTIRDIFGLHDEVAVAAALLHDTIEDTGVDYDDVLALAGREVADIVASLTKDMRLREDIREPAYDAQLAEADWRARVIKLADVYDNLADCHTRRGDRDPASTIGKARRAIDLARSEAEVNPVMADAIRAVESHIAAVESPSESPRAGWED